MLLEKLVLCDVGTFRGEHTFDLHPRIKSGQSRTVVLFGGLNGAGKTTLLNSIRHALYGRQALDVSVTQKGYEEHLRGMINDGLGQLVKPANAHVDLHFTYSRLGKRVRYKVTRSWTTRGNAVEETLTVTQDDDVKPLLEGDGAQAFLSQLIPAGVSQFFFFDGEKIAALAKDDSDEVLADAIRRLLGLDMADRLRSDLSVFLRARRAENQRSDVTQELAEMYAEVAATKASIKTDEATLESFAKPLRDAKEEVERRKGILTDQGGFWAVNRKSLDLQLDHLATKRATLEDQVREQLGGISVFGLAPKLCKALLEQTDRERRIEDERQAFQAVTREAEKLKDLLSRALAKSELKATASSCVDDWIAEISSRSSQDRSPTHGISGSDAATLVNGLQRQLPTELARIRSNSEQLGQTTAEVTSIQDQLAYAPSDESIQESFKGYQDATQRVAELEMTARVQLENIRLRISSLILLFRKIKKLEEQAEKSGVASKAELLADRVQTMITDFKVAAAEAKCKTLERYFVAAFRRLARKEDIVDHAIIDPSTFSVTLVDKHGTSTPKQRLSSGEKQIFAIAMLEALAKTSGRNLPIIIDTPLGRLDSKHRARLVESYFPTASHQVLVLSTDTEVDQVFYDGLRSSISHAFHLAFDEAEGCTQVTEGYFWKHKELKNAA